MSLLSGGPDGNAMAGLESYGSDGAILDRTVAAIRRDGPTRAIKDSVPVDLWRRALRLARR